MGALLTNCSDWKFTCLNLSLPKLTPLMLGSEKACDFNSRRSVGFNGGTNKLTIEVRDLRVFIKHFACLSSTAGMFSGTNGTTANALPSKGLLKRPESSIFSFRIAYTQDAFSIGCAFVFPQAYFLRP